MNKASFAFVFVDFPSNWSAPLHSQPVFLSSSIFIAMAPTALPASKYDYVVFLCLPRCLHIFLSVKFRWNDTKIEDKSRLLGDGDLCCVCV